MRVTVTYTDNTSFSGEEVRANAQHLLGRTVEVRTLPNNETPEAFILHGIRGIISSQQVSEYFDGAYEARLPIIRDSTIKYLTELLDQVILENEQKLGNIEYVTRFSS